MPFAKARAKSTAGSLIWVRVCRATKRMTAILLATLLTVEPVAISTARAQQIIDPSAPIRFRPSIGVSANGTPKIDIAAPSFGGVSHNKFQRYDVDTRGVILNNSGLGGTSVIGGAVSANPNLVGGPTAKVIVNEVTSALPSSLNGPTEVFGSRADVIIANPNGVTCGSCSFINAGRVTLTTGVPKPDYQTGAVSYSVTGGTVSVTGNGLVGTNLGDIDLIGRQITVTAPIDSSGNVRLRAGAGVYDQAADQKTALPAGITAPPVSEPPFPFRVGAPSAPERFRFCRRTSISASFSMDRFPRFQDRSPFAPQAICRQRIPRPRVTSRSTPTAP